jgi:hypothetical protein
MTVNKIIGQTISCADAAEYISDQIALSSNTSTTILEAEAGVALGLPSKRVSIIISSVNKDIWVKLQPASVDDDKKGIFLQAGKNYILTSSVMYFGEISAIGNTPNAIVCVTVI